MAATPSSSQSQIDMLDRDLCFVLMKGKMYTRVSEGVETVRHPAVYTVYEKDRCYTKYLQKWFAAEY